jgi:hypothetical protein
MSEFGYLLRIKALVINDYNNFRSDIMKVVSYLGWDSVTE